MVNDNARSTQAYLVAQGLPPAAAAGVVGNLIAESSVNPSAIGDGGTSAGIAQWHKSRWQQLQAWAAARGLSWRTLQAQQAFLVHELRAMGVWAKLQRTTDPDTAAAIVMRDYEKPASTDPTARQRYARQVLATAGGVPSTSPTGGEGGGGGGGTATGTPASFGLPGAGGLTSGIRDLSITLAVAALGLALVGVGVVQVAKGRPS